MVKVVVVKFKSGGKLYYFAPKEGDVYTRNMPVIVETSKGAEYAWVAYPEKEVEEEEITPPLKSILRIASEKDKAFYKACQEKKPEAMSVCKQKIIELGLDMKLVDCEYAFDGSKIVFFFTSPTRVDFRELVRALASTFKNRIELRQVGTRDETKYLGGLAPCGRICCCAGNMPEFKKVTVKMAKTQGLSLNPGKISGLCGRLMCCLSYENDYYAEAFKQVPKVGSEATAPDGTGTVVSVNMLKMQAKILFSDALGNVAYRDYPVSDLKFKKPTQNKDAQKDENEDESDVLPSEKRENKQKNGEKKNANERADKRGEQGAKNNEKDRQKHRNKKRTNEERKENTSESNENKNQRVFDTTSLFTS